MKHLALLTRVFAFFIGALAVHAQNNPPLPPGAKLVPVRNLAVCFLYAPSTPDLYFQDARGEYTPLKIDTSRFGSWNVIPDTDTLELFTKVITPEMRTVDPVTKRETVQPAIITYKFAQTWTLPPGKDSLRKLYYYNADGTVAQRDFGTSHERHGAHHARVINLLNQTIAVRFDEQKAMINAGQELVLEVASPLGNFGFQYGLEQEGTTPYVSPLKKLSFRRPQQRLTVIVGYLPIVESTDGRTSKITGYAPNALRFYEDIDRLPPPPAPVVVMPRLAQR